MIGLFVLLVSLSSAIGSSASFGVCLTTIPPRFSTVHHVVSSWLSQEIPPATIAIFVPRKYKNFISESPRDKSRNIAALTNELKKHFPADIDSRRIIVQAMDQDWGPITKYAGLLQHFQELDPSGDIDYWVIGDDDVRYLDTTLSDYWRRIQDGAPPVPVLTHFKIESRVNVNITGVFTPVQHIQGVDTVLLPRHLLLQQAKSNGVLSHDIFTTGVEEFHKVCPDSFYQDDYIMSFLVAISGASVESVWTGGKVAHHVTGVSKSNQQMHIHPNVFKREETAKACTIVHGSRVKTFLDTIRNASKEGTLSGTRASEL
mmetsp:Transcript_19971/g.28693  ORF Transcript_19971/g.28693 Transcript_19971/m.28693 type:complete len:316 (+) Transcript_19971:51-998(+)